MNELELFEAYMKKEHPFIDVKSEAYEAMWNLWQARVPEGYVIVPKEPTREMMQAVVDEVKKSGYLVDFYKAMIEAVEK